MSALRDVLAHLLLATALKVGTQDFALYLTRIGDDWRARRRAEPRGGDDAG